MVSAGCISVLSCRIIHCLNDLQVDPNQSLKLGKALQSTDVDLIFRKNSGHIVHEPHDLELFLVTLDRSDEL